MQNAGDGSAYPEFMESEKLAIWDQEHMDEGWGEACVGSLVIKSENPVQIDNITTHLGYLLNRIHNENLEEPLIKEFLESFFPNGIPKVEIKLLKLIDVDPGDKFKYHELEYLSREKRFYKLFCRRSFSIEKAKQQIKELEDLID